MILEEGNGYRITAIDPTDTEPSGHVGDIVYYENTDDDGPNIYGNYNFKGTKNGIDQNYPWQVETNGGFTLCALEEVT
jgi:hypothetical protein